MHHPVMLACTEGRLDVLPYPVCFHMSRAAMLLCTGQQGDHLVNLSMALDSARHLTWCASAGSPEAAAP